MAMEVEVQRLELGDVILVDGVQAIVAREPERTETSIRARLRVAGRDDFVQEWPLGDLVTVVRGP